MQHVIDHTGSVTFDKLLLLLLSFTPVLLFQVLDASNFSKGPVAKLWLNHHVPHGLHGFFSPKYFGPES